MTVEGRVLRKYSGFIYSAPGRARPASTCAAAAVMASWRHKAIMVIRGSRVVALVAAGRETERPTGGGEQ